MAISKTEVQSNDATGVGRADMKFEIVVIPVSDLDRAKEFYGRLGWRLDADYATEDFRVLQFTPPGSGCSVIFGKNVTAAAPGSAQGVYLIVSDIEAARMELLGRGVKVSEVFHNEGVYVGPNEPYLSGRVRVSGLAPEHDVIMIGAGVLPRRPRSRRRAAGIREGARALQRCRHVTQTRHAP